MQIKEIVGYIFLMIVIVFVVREIFPKKEIETVIEYEYLPGKPDTVKTIDTLKILKPYPVYFPSDTVKIDSSGEKMFTAPFKINVDSSTGVSGRVSLIDSSFSFKNIELWFPKIYISQVDTLLKTVTKVVRPAFYEDTWFWTTLGSLSLLLTLIFSGGS